MQQNTRHPIVCLILLLSLWRNSNSTASPSGMTHNIQRLEGLDDKLFGQNEMRTYLILSKNLGSSSPSYNLAPRHQTLHCLLIGKCVVESEDWLIDWLIEGSLPSTHPKLRSCDGGGGDGLSSCCSPMPTSSICGTGVLMPCRLWCVCFWPALGLKSTDSIVTVFVIVYSVSQLFVCLFVCF